MESLPPINLVLMVHLVVLSLWGGVVAVEAVIELYPYRRREFQTHAIEYHYWIDSLVELPLIVAVVVSGTVLAALAWPLDGLHLLKIGCASVAVIANLVCIGLVIARRRLMKSGASADELWRKTRGVVLCAVVGMPAAAVAVGLGFWLGYHRMVELIVH